MKRTLKAKINVLGTEYKVYETPRDGNKRLQDNDGYIFLEKKEIYLDEECAEIHKECVLVHELVHAFMYESGLDLESWGRNEEIVDWIALQAFKIANAGKKAIADIRKKES